MFKVVNGRLVLSDLTYDVSRKLVQVILPACGALYFGLAAIWDLPNAEQVVGTIAVVTTFLGVTLGISSSQYEKSGAAYDGNMVVTIPDEGPKLFSLEVDGDPEELVHKDSLKFKVSSENVPVPPEVDTSE